MKVFGIGLNKTGTSSLGHALRILGYEDHIDGRPDLLRKWTNGEIEPILTEAEKFNNFEDWPWPLIYKELYQKFPEARFILTTRSTPEVWFKSLCNHADRTGPTKQRELVYGYAMPQEYKNEHLQFYAAHNAGVISFFKKHDPSKLLVVSWEDGNNWEKLCAFLGKEIPSVPFPHFKPLAENAPASSVKSPLWKRLFKKR